MTLLLSEFPKDFLAGSAGNSDGFTIDRPPWRGVFPAGADMPLDPPGKALSCHDGGGDPAAMPPAPDFDEPSPSRDAFAEDYLLDRTTLEADLADYLPNDADLADPGISSLRAAVAGLPAAIIHTAEFDPMRDEGSAYARKLMAAGVAVEHICHGGMIHNFHAMGAILPQGRLVRNQIGEQVGRAVEN
jgi:acetyl esterase/lipase